MWEFPGEKQANELAFPLSVDHGWVSTGELALVCWVQGKLSL